MKKNPKYSVIIPVYNAQQTLPACMESLLCQGYADAEFILVDDGSEDHSGFLCRELAATNAQIKYISQANSGVSAARNAGLAAAEGEFLLFVDSDDTVEADYFANLDSLDSKGEYDLLWFSHKRVGAGRDQLYALSPGVYEKAADCTRIFSQALYRKTLNPLWNKRYRTNIIREHGLKFPEGISIGEDTVFNLQYVMLCESCKMSDAVLYCFHQENRQSLTRSGRTDLSGQLQMQGEALLQAIRQAAVEESVRKQYLQAFHAIKLRSVYSTAKRMHLAKIPAGKRRREIAALCNEINRNYKALPDDRFCRLLRIPVRLRVTVLIDLTGKLLAERNERHR